MGTYDKIIAVSPAAPDPSVIDHAAGIIMQGGVVVFPTSGLYGLGVNAFNPAAIQKIFDIKKRQPENPILILIKHADELDRLVRDIPKKAEIIMKRFWPGRVTLVFHAHESLPTTLTAGTGMIGIRMPEHPVASALVHALSFPMTGTSANLSGSGGCATIQNMPPELIEQTDLVLDAGPLKGGTGSTVIDITTDPIRIIREGSIPSSEIFQIAG